MSPSLTVRRIAADQGAVFRELRTASLREAPYAFGETLEDALSADAATFDATAAEHAVSFVFTSFILYTEGHPAGLIEAYFDDSEARRAFVCELWVAPAVRHLRGGELLVDTASAWLAGEGAMEIYAWVADANRNAMRFYEALGFGPTGEHRRVARAPEQAESLLVRHVPTTSQVFQQ
ncbi:GNAT family N-acetyltransferase [Paraburkholderia nemoris]|jgi:ribosomal protein S18 acetylase RimI-like enzyme|uniref:N-acetyltransferase domain-containing protein n=1 Tax=Paraburkholderia nemoris TaxID=2793076 RepID=A0ABM8QNB4_9BURK|nr:MULTISPECIES: GNAT family N-acetyltransferase [Paraburkholderia]KPD19147.1 GCN5 family acetyltransferase [Burkholderia sp. ST111]MBK5152193.1 GNAT family N-acetyltransferase [Burkholderia sp. R-69608]MBK3743534.1 GNAT family N-acetyltransferase [Paraburkholderia aspalathi]MBK3781071.1 GNAT family N-acetyltransferase [Paraburkholderia aspalathi]MBK3808962.1 GNAT family N-acetyltransferase [Paraburkholderia aspalathi]